MTADNKYSMKNVIHPSTVQQKANENQHTIFINKSQQSIVIVLVYLHNTFTLA